MTRDWDSEQKPLQDEQEAALSERVRLKPSGSATPDEFTSFRPRWRDTKRQSAACPPFSSIAFGMIPLGATTAQTVEW